MQEGPQVLAQVGALQNVDLCNRDSNFQVGNLTERVSERNTRLYRMESSMDILLKRREPNIDSANSQMYIVESKQSLGMVQRVHTEGLLVISYLCAGKDGAVLDQNHVPNEQQEADVARQLGDFASTSDFGSDLTLEVRSVSVDLLALQRFENVVLDERREALTAFGYVRIASMRFAARADVVKVVEDERMQVADVVAVARQHFNLVWVVRYFSS